MSERFVTIDVNSKELQASLKKYPYVIRRHWIHAGHEAAKKILRTRGVKNYPKAPPDNAPPYPGYLRGVGYIDAGGESDGRSERYGTRFNVQTKGVSTIIGNTASYAGYLAGSGEAGEEKQSTVINKNIPGRGWRILAEVADEKGKVINEVYTKWVRRALREIGLL